MLKIRLQGTKNDIRWFVRLLQRDKRFEVNNVSTFFDNVGTDKYKRVYAEVSRKKKDSGKKPSDVMQVEEKCHYIGNAHLFGRRIDDDVVKNAATISLMYITLCCTGGLIISVSEELPMLTCLFETASAVGTVGLSLGITPELNLLSRSVLILLMFFGRVGGLTLIFAALSSAQKKVSKLPKEKITVG